MNRSIIGLIASLAVSLSTTIACHPESPPWHWDEEAEPISLPLQLDLSDEREAARWETGAAIRSIHRHSEGLEADFDEATKRGRTLSRFLPIAPDHLGTIELVTREPESPIEVGVYIRGALEPDYTVEAVPDSTDPRRQRARFRVGRWQRRAVQGIRLGIDSDTPSLTLERVVVSSERHAPVAHPQADTDWRSAFVDHAVDTPKNVILIVADTLRADALSLMGAERVTSPALDRLAEYGTSFESVSSQAPCTFPSVNSLLASQPVSTFLGKPHRDSRSLEGRGSIADRLRAKGFETWAVSTSWVVRATESVHNDWGGGYDAGFERFDEHCAGQRADCANEVALRLIDGASASDRPFFLYLHYLDPHDPYRPPADFPRKFARDDTKSEFVLRGDPNPLAEQLYGGNDASGISRDDVKGLRDRYDDEIRYLDSEIHRLFEALRQRHLLSDSLIVFTSDHGESFLEHGHLKHCRSLYDDQIRVPLVFWIPGSNATGMRRSPVQLLDVVPTILDYMDLGSGAPRLQGRSLRSVIEENQNHEQIAFANTAGFRSARDERFKWIENQRTGSGLLFDLDRDPKESTDVSASHPAIKARLAGALRARQETDPADLEAVERHLKALGYLE